MKNNNATFKPIFSLFSIQLASDGRYIIKKSVHTSPQTLNDSQFSIIELASNKKPNSLPPEQFHHTWALEWENTDFPAVIAKEAKSNCSLVLCRSFVSSRVRVRDWVIRFRVRVGLSSSSPRIKRNLKSKRTSRSRCGKSGLFSADFSSVPIDSFLYFYPFLEKSSLNSLYFVILKSLSATVKPRT